MAENRRVESRLTRYCSFSRFVSFLTDGVFLAKSSSFEDPWEGHVFHGVMAEPKNKKNLAAFVADRKQYIYVSCWHASEHESYAMWRIYGQSDAVAIHTDGGKLRALLKTLYEDCRAKPALLSEVVYCEPVQGRLPPLDNDKKYSVSYEDTLSEKERLWREAVQQLFMYKPPAYTYEQEVRLIAVDPDAPEFLVLSENSSERVGISVPVNLNEFVTAVSVAPWADSAFVNAVKAVSEKFGLPPERVRKSTLFQQPGM